LDFGLQIGCHRQGHAVLANLGRPVGVGHAADLAQPPVKALGKDGRRLLQIHCAGPAQHFAKHVRLHGGISGHHAGGVKDLANEAGDAVKRSVHAPLC